MERVVMVSGGFDPLHVGHLAFFEAAKKEGSSLVVAVDSDDFVAKKHKVLMPQIDRARIVLACKLVDAVLCAPAGSDVSPCLEMVRPAVFCVGEDHADLAFPEAKTCCRLGTSIKVIKSGIRKSSSELLMSAVATSYDNPPVTVSVILESDDATCVLLNRRAFPDGLGKLELVGGFLEKGESLEGAAIREAEEEAGTTLIDLRYFGSFPGTYSDGRKLLSVVFLAKLGKTPVITKESLGFEWVMSSPPREAMFVECDRDALVRYFSQKRGSR